MISNIEINLHNETIIGDKFTEEDKPFFKEIFDSWLKLSQLAKSYGGRGINVPEILSEGLFSLEYDAVRTNNIIYSYDCVKDGLGVQLKATSIIEDCSSFGPTSDWDLLYFMDFCPNGNIDGNIWFYKIENDDLSDIIVNEKKNETFAEQQRQGRRPRFSIKRKLIIPNNLQPEKRINLTSYI